MFSSLFVNFLSGFFVKGLASFDDTLTRIPVIAELTRGLRGKIAFSVGTFVALSVILVVVVFFSFVFDLIPYTNIVVAGLIAILAFIVYFEILGGKPERKMQQKINVENISNSRFLKLIFIGFVVSFVTLIDDSIVLTSLFIENSNREKLFAVLGIYAATLIQVGLVIYFGERLNKVKYKKEMASLALVLLAGLVLFGIV